PVSVPVPYEPPFRSEGRTAVVTGAASGIGAALARALHERGARVLLADLAEAVTDTAAQLGQPHWTGDVSTESGVDDLLATAEDRSEEHTSELQSRFD